MAATEASFSYTPGAPRYGQTFARATTATYVANTSDVGLLYWPGALHGTQTFTRATAATYVTETTAQ